jgi:hypothetical protein
MSGLNIVRNLLAVKGAVDLIKGDRISSVNLESSLKANSFSNQGSKKMPRLLIIGHGRHGKDTLAEIFNRDYGMKFKASSMAASEIFIYNVLKDKYGYNSPDECLNDRSNHRKEWYDLICSYNLRDKARLAKDIMTTSNCYVGMRDRDEIDECMKQGVFDLVIWVDASNRLPKESKDSFNITKKSADILISNNGTIEEFEIKASRLGKILFT